MKPEKKIVQLTTNGVWHIKAKSYRLTMCWRRVPLGVRFMRHAVPDVHMCRPCVRKTRILQVSTERTEN